MCLSFSKAGIPAPTRQSLSPQQQRLLTAFQHLRYGTIPRLEVRNGQPVLDRGLKWKRTVKVLGENLPHPSSQSEDFVLRREYLEFFRLLVELGDGEVTNLEVRNGLPFTFEVSETFAD
jgi:hypothetical protein